RIAAITSRERSAARASSSRATRPATSARSSTSAAIAARDCRIAPTDISSSGSSVRITRGPTISAAACSPRRTCRPTSARTSTPCTAPLVTCGMDTPSCFSAARGGTRGSGWGGGGDGREGQEGQERPERMSLREQLADLPERFAAWNMSELRLGRRIVYDVRANWKLIVLNYNECLHCPNLHPALNRLHH